jgi:regulatory protein
MSHHPRSRSAKGSLTGPAPPDTSSLREAALTYLARYAATEAALRRVLAKRIDQWARSQTDPDQAAPIATAAREAIEGVIATLVRAGAVSDASFAEARARTLLRAGRSRRAIQAGLVAKGVSPELAHSAAGDDVGTELAAALILTRRRRIGPFRAIEPEDLMAVRRKELGMLARAGFARDTAEQALNMDAAEAERRIRALRSDQAIME